MLKPKPLAAHRVPRRRRRQAGFIDRLDRVSLSLVYFGLHFVPHVGFPACFGGEAVCVDAVIWCPKISWVLKEDVVRLGFK